MCLFFLFDAVFFLLILFVFVLTFYSKSATFLLTATFTIGSGWMHIDAILCYAKKRHGTHYSELGLRLLCYLRGAR